MKRRNVLLGLLGGLFGAKAAPAALKGRLFDYPLGDVGPLQYYNLPAPALNLFPTSPRVVGQIMSAKLVDRGCPIQMVTKIKDEAFWQQVKDGGMKNFSVGYDPRAVRTASPTEEVVTGEDQMFTIKTMGDDGNYVTSCAAYHYRPGTYNQNDTVETICRLELYDADHKVSGVLAVGADLIFIMNEAGATIDKYEPMTPDHPMRRAVERTPLPFRRKYWPTAELCDSLDPAVPVIPGVNYSRPVEAVKGAGPGGAVQL